MKRAIAAFGNHQSEPRLAMLRRMIGFSSAPPDASAALVVATSRICTIAIAKAEMRIKKRGCRWTTVRPLVGIGMGKPRASWLMRYPIGLHPADDVLRAFR